MTKRNRVVRAWRRKVNYRYKFGKAAKSAMRFPHRNTYLNINKVSFLS